MNRPSGELERLLNLLTDDLLSEAEEVQLAQVLQHDANARQQYRRWMTLHANLMWDYAAVASCEPLKSAIPTPRGISRHALWTVLAVSIALVVGWSLSLVWNSGGTGPTIAWLEEVQGSVTWTDGSTEAPFSPGTRVRLASGTIVLDGEDSAAQLRFDDGTLIVLNGDAELAFSGEYQKKLVLRRGNLSAQVQPQPRDQPMLVRTPTAEVEVLGTVFALSTRVSGTELNVDSGSVKLRRLVDGTIVKVGAQQNVVASLTTTPLIPTDTRMAPKQWRLSFAQAPSELHKGDWLPPKETVPGRLKSTPFVAGRRPDGTPIIHHGVFCRGVLGSSGGFVTLDRDSVIRVRYRLDRETQVMCFLSCRSADAAFAGNFLVLIQTPGPADVNGWREDAIPLTTARAIMKDKFPSLLGTQLRVVSIHTIEQEVGLKVAEVEIGPAGD